MSYYLVQDGLLFKSYLPRYLRKRSTFRDQLVVPEALVGLILHAYREHVVSGGHLASRPTHEIIRQTYIGGPPLAATYESGAKNAKLVNDEKQHKTDSSPRQAI